MNKEEFAEKVLDLEGSMYRVAKTMLRNEEDCADAMQSAILKAYEKLDTLRNIDYFKTWLIRILINECYQLIRKNKKYVGMEEYLNGQVEGVQNQQADEKLEISAIMQEVMRLDEKYRVPFVLHEVEGYSLKEISRMLRLTEANAKSRIFRARKILRTRLEGEV